MSIATQLRSGIATIGHQIATHKKQVAAGVGGAVVLGAVAGCVPQQPPKEGTTFASDEFGRWDTNADGAVGLDEATQRKERYYSETTRERLDYSPDMVRVTTRSYRETFDSSIAKLVRAAGGSDAIASWQEIGDFAVSRYDKADKNGVKDGLLDNREQNAFRNEYQSQKLNSVTELLSRSEVIIYDPIDRGTPHYPGSGGAGNGPIYEPTDPDHGSGSDTDNGPVYDDTDPGRSNGPVFSAI